MHSAPSRPGPETAARAESFGRNRRLLRRADYLETYSAGLRHAGRWLVFFVRPGAGQGARLGVTITKKTGSAVVRNRLRRRLRELFRRSGLFTAPVDVVVNVRPGAERADFAGAVARFRQDGPAGRRGEACVSGTSGHSPNRAALGAAWLLSCYKRFLSPLLPAACRFQPTCSEYAREAILRHGVLKGAWLSILRLSRCHPFHPGGFDPVP